MAERRLASPAGAVVADFSSAMRRIGMLAGAVRSAGALGTKENPVMVPLAPRLTSAVTCCHRALLSEITSSPPFLRDWGRDDRDGGTNILCRHAACFAAGSCLRMAWTCGSPGLLEFSNSTAASCAAPGGAPTIHLW